MNCIGRLTLIGQFGGSFFCSAKQVFSLSFSLIAVVIWDFVGPLEQAIANDAQRVATQSDSVAFLSIIRIRLS
jgi:hypothetical protein